MTIARPRQFWRFRRLRRDNIALRRLIGRLVSLLDRSRGVAPDPSWGLHETLELQQVNEDIRRLAAARDIGA